MKQLKKGTKCEWKGCRKNAIVLAWDNVDKVLLLCCEDHAYEAADRGHPEYVVNCPNCNCKFGVN
jgi:hypothetical protein